MYVFGLVVTLLAALIIAGFAFVVIRGCLEE